MGRLRTRLQIACKNCGVLVVTMPAQFCSKQCYGASRRGKKHSPSRCAKIAKSNTGKVFPLSRREAISKAKTAKRKALTAKQLNRLDELWELRCVNPIVIRKEVGLSSRHYNQLFVEKCKIPQIPYCNSLFEPDDIRKIIELAKQHVYFVEISRVVGHGKKAIASLITKLGLPVNTRNPDAYKFCTPTKPERFLHDRLRRENIDFEVEFFLKPFYFDVHIVGTNILIEVHGDYWHCNPDVYKSGPINDTQKKMMRRDFAKRELAKKTGFRRYVVWECGLTDEKLDALVAKIRVALKENIE